MRTKKFILITPSLYVLLLALLLATTAVSAASRCCMPKACYTSLWNRLSPQERALQTCRVNCQCIHWDWIQKCDAGSSRNYSACSTVAKTALLSCFAACVAPKKSCYSLPDSSKGF